MDSLPGAPPAVRELLEPRPLTDIRPGLERTREMLAALWDPHESFGSLQVAGTNGKGSVTAAAAAVLGARPGAGGPSGSAPVGAYLSPHVVSFGERIRIGGDPAPDALLEDCADRLLPEADRVDATHFEALTVLSFLAFAEAGVEWAVVEVGMGGRLDATTVLEPEACAVTPVSLDHEAHLGRGLAAVAREKAGVLRRGVPAALAPQPPEVDAALEERAEEVGAPLFRLGRDGAVSHVDPDLEGTGLRYRSERLGEGAELRTGLAGRHQADNAGLALLMLEAAGVEWTREEARRGLAGLHLPGRLQVVPREGMGRGPWILDLAHNPAAVEAFLAALEELAPPRPWSAVCSVLGDKDWLAVLEELSGHVDALTCTVAPSAPASRRWELDEVDAWLEGSDVGAGRVEPDLGRALARAAELAGAGTVVVTGSSYLVGDVLRDHDPSADAG